MDIDAVVETIQALTLEQQQAEETAQAASARSAALKKILEGYRELYPTLDLNANATTNGDAELGTTELIRRKLRSNVGKWYTVGLMIRELQQDGWVSQATDPQNTVRTVLERISTSMPLRKSKGSQGGVTYSYRPFENDTTPDLPEGGGAKPPE